MPEANFTQSVRILCAPWGKLTPRERATALTLARQLGYRACLHDGTAADAFAAVVTEHYGYRPADLGEREPRVIAFAYGQVVEGLRLAGPRRQLAAV